MKLDTSGNVRLRGQYANGQTHEVTFWSDLDPFTQGYVEALFASLRFYHLECPSCEWDCIVGPPSVGDLGIMCPLCAGDSGRDVMLRALSGERDLPAKVEGADARNGARFANVAPETLARIMEDCAADQEVGRQLNLAGNREDRRSAKAGAAYWRERQTGNLRDAPPLTPYLADDGRVHLRESV